MADRDRTALERALARVPSKKEQAERRAADRRYERIASENARIYFALQMVRRHKLCAICHTRPVGAGMTCGRPPVREHLAGCGRSWYGG